MDSQANKNREVNEVKLLPALDNTNTPLILGCGTPKRKDNTHTRAIWSDRKLTGTIYDGESYRPQQRGKTSTARRTNIARARDGLRPITVDIPYHTAITQPPPKRSHTPKFDALNRTMVPLPKLFDTNTVSCHPRIDISEWRKQVTKDVPRRPAFAVCSLDSSVKVKKFLIDDTFVQSSSCFFRRADGSGFDKEFVINPEWASERMHLHGHKAYRTSGIRYGWCF